MQAPRPRAEEVALTCLAQLAATSAELHGLISQFTEPRADPVWTGAMGYRQLPSLRARRELVERVSSALRLLTAQGQLYRRAEAQALYAAGLSMAEVAAVLGVSRQRVAALLREPLDSPAPA